MPRYLRGDGGDVSGIVKLPLEASTFLITITIVVCCTVGLETALVTAEENMYSIMKRSEAIQVLALV